MAGRKRPRKARSARGPIATTRSFVLDRLLPMRAAQTLDLGIAYHVAYDELLKGRGGEEHWSTVVVALNIALVMAEQGPGADSIVFIKEALDGAVRTRDAARLSGIWEFDEDAKIDIAIALRAHDGQMSVTPQALVSAALAEVHRRIDAGHAFTEAA
jgi:hypothetical protein